MRRKTMNQALREELTISRAAFADADERRKKAENRALDLGQQVFNLRDEMRLGVEAAAKLPFRTISVVTKDVRGRIVSVSEHHLDEFDTFNYSSDGYSHQAESTKAV